MRTDTRVDEVLDSIADARRAIGVAEALLHELVEESGDEQMQKGWYWTRKALGDCGYAGIEINKSTIRRGVRA